MPDRFYFYLGSSLAERSAKIYEKCSTLSIFSRLGPFSQVFVQVKELIISEMHEIIKRLHVVACPMLFFSGGLKI